VFLELLGTRQLFATQFTKGSLAFQIDGGLVKVGGLVREKRIGVVVLLLTDATIKG
jgi:hypothetical protein